MTHHTFLHDHGFEDLDCHEPPDFNRWILRRGLEAIEAGIHDPILEEAISIADRIRLPCTRDPFPPDELMNPKVTVGPAQVGSVLLQAKGACVLAPAEAQRLARNARVCAATLQCQDEVKSDLVALSLMVDANVLRIQNQFGEAEELLRRSERLLKAGCGALGPAAYLFAIRGRCGDDVFKYAQAEVSSTLSYLAYVRLYRGADAGLQLWGLSNISRATGKFSVGLSQIDRARTLIPAGHPLRHLSLLNRALLLSDLGRTQAARFDIQRSSLYSIGGRLQVLKAVYTAGAVERDLGNVRQGRKLLLRASEGFAAQLAWGHVASVHCDLALLEYSARDFGAADSHSRRVANLVQAHDLPRELLSSLEDRLQALRGS